MTVKKESKKMYINDEHKKIERAILLKLFEQKRNALVNKKTSKQDIDEIREIIKKLRKLRGI